MFKKINLLLSTLIISLPSMAGWSVNLDDKGIYHAFSPIITAGNFENVTIFEDGSIELLQSKMEGPCPYSTKKTVASYDEQLISMKVSVNRSDLFGCIFRFSPATNKGKDFIVRRFKMKEHVEFSIFDGISILIDTAGYQQALESANNLNKQVL